ncbi:hypothetical protein EYF80_012157 [Liparis tanakae]|uniref:Uncharacterized protein n=1 Tax=Liparis tanakae TaxID=230148 RepID=A0A4Z2IIH3_9TELE|nr:hypothetical protein EYF80_012157 [Liparis tanakae]
MVSVKGKKAKMKEHSHTQTHTSLVSKVRLAENRLPLRAGSGRREDLDSYQCRRVWLSGYCYEKDTPYLTAPQGHRNGLVEEWSRDL